ncbi:hypothetical protein N7451_003593 [Penicillium sp. IBT 35674x]|nr:hypothetical protein N7451_003593 [Penicillium sp. IBT 35674x]
MATYTPLNNQSLDNTDAEQLDIHERKRFTPMLKLNRAAVLSTVVVVLSFFAIALAIINHNPYNYSRAFHFDCGETPSDAARLGCKFDLSSFTWVPRTCFDSELMEDFLSTSDWRWSLDRDGYQIVTEEYARTGQFERLYTTAAYHATHCKYTYKRLTQAMLSRDQTSIDGYIGNVRHLEHCMDTIGMMNVGNGVDANRTVFGFTKMASCGQGVFESGYGWFGWDNGEKVWEFPEV